MLAVVTDRGEQIGHVMVVQPGEGVSVKVIAGAVGDARGPISQPATDPLYLDIGLEADRSWEYVLPEGHNAFAYVFEGGVVIGDGDRARKLGTHEMAVLGGGDVFKATASNDARLILVAGRPLREPVVRYGPFVMNTKQEIMQAFVDFQEGRF